MSTIASPRDSPAPPNRRMNSSHALTTPTSSTRPSLDLPHSTSGSPNPNPNNPPPTTTINKRANRAALREYYHLQKVAAENNITNPSTPTLEITPDSGLTSPTTDSSSFMPPSELDAPNFNPPQFISKTLASSSLSELLRTYARILGEIRALDAEKKALVYDNYSKLISATETIRKMRSTMDPLNPMASTLDLVVAKIYEKASGIREELRGGLAAMTEEGRRRKDTEGGGEGEEDSEEERTRRRAQTRALAVEVLEVPGRLRRLMVEGKWEEARTEWEVPRRLLERWREEGVGGEDVDRLIREGDEIVGSLSSGGGD